MPKFKFSADEGDRIYEQYGLVVPGRVVEADEAPDFRWSETTDDPTDAPPAPPFLPEELRHVGPPVEVQIALQELAAAEQAKADPPADPKPSAPAVKTPPAPPAPPAAPADEPPAQPAA